MSIYTIFSLLLLMLNTELSHSLFVNQSTYECNNTTERCGCSIASSTLFRTRRILGGERVTIHQTWPWMVSLRRWGHHICGGVIISSFFILTAAHCIPSTGLAVAIGIIQQSNLTANDPRIRAITKVYLHSNYSDQTMLNDLALLRLEQRIRHRYLIKICLPVKSDPLPVDSDVIAIGFGHEKKFSIRSSDYLRQVKLRILSPTSSACKDELTDPPTQICAGLERANIDTCKGDSGGPLMYFSPVRQRFELAGIISFGAGCGDANHAGIYTRVSSYLDWIESIISK